MFGKVTEGRRVKYIRLVPHDSDKHDLLTTNLTILKLIRRDRHQLHTHTRNDCPNAPVGRCRHPPARCSVTLLPEYLF